MLQVIFIITVALLLIIAGMRPIRSNMSLFERRRRASAGDVSARDLIRREKLLDDVLSFRRVLVALLLISISGLDINIYGWVYGIGLSIVISIWYGALSRTRIIQAISSRIYARFEHRILRFVEKYPLIFKTIGSDKSKDEEMLRQLDSREELQYLVDQSTEVLNNDDKLLVSHSLAFRDRLVKDCMTPRSAVDTIKQGEFLGPLKLDELHKTGHSRLPVIDGDIDHVVGILHLRELLNLDIKNSTTAEKAMESKVYYIKEDQTLEHALKSFIRTHHHLFIVVNEYRETTGILTLEDVVEQLIGQKIVDEFDSHDDLRAVALRNPHHNNLAPKREDL